MLQQMGDFHRNTGLRRLTRASTAPCQAPLTLGGRERAQATTRGPGANPTRQSMQGKARRLGQALPFVRAIDMQHERPGATRGTEAGAQRAPKHRPGFQLGLLTDLRRRGSIEQPRPVVSSAGRHLLMLSGSGSFQESVKHRAAISRIQAKARNVPGAFRHVPDGIERNPQDLSSRDPRIPGATRRAWGRTRVSAHVCVKRRVGCTGLELRRLMAGDVAGNEAVCRAWVRRLPYANGPQAPCGSGPAGACDDRKGPRYPASAGLPHPPGAGRSVRSLSARNTWCVSPIDELQMSAAARTGILISVWAHARCASYA
jgi:hypothetical protein